MTCSYGVVAERHISLFVDDGFGFFQSLFATILVFLWNYDVCIDTIESGLAVHFLQQLRGWLEVDAFDAYVPVFRLGLFTFLFILGNCLF